MLWVIDSIEEWRATFVSKSIRHTFNQKVDLTSLQDTLFLPHLQ